MSKTIIITGTSAGFGKLIAQTSVSKGYNVIATMRDADGKNKSNADKLIEYSRDQPGSMVVVELDVSSDTSVENAINDILAKHDKIDVLVNNAGIGGVGLTEGFTTDQLNHILNVNVLGVHRVTKGVLPTMRKHGAGLIINISSIMGRIVIPFSTAYTASKFALEGYTESLRYELKGLGIDIAIIEPGGFGTNFFGSVMAPADTETLESYGAFKDTPEKMFAGFGEALQSDTAPNPQDIADAVDEMIDMPQGQRPVRMVVDPMSGGEGPAAINQTTDQIQKAILESFGMS
ncbi:MAG: SDR family oxidoreductase [Cyclobacteriaceae bacterium]|nr:SDR family oxidoreductase [Cyclobacteriaceae bacterium]